MNVPQLEQVTGFAVPGMGTMGIGSIVTFLEAGYDVIGYDESADARATARDKVLRGLQWVEKNRKGADKQPIHPAGFADEAIGRFQIVESLNDLIAAQNRFQIVHECIFENMRKKQELLAALAAGLTPDHIFWSITSSLNPLEMGRPADITSRLVVVHFMNPVYMMPAAEMVVTDDVLDAVAVLSRAILEQRMNKVAFEAPNSSGFWVNGLGVPMWIDALRYFERGHITAGDGDAGLKASVGHPQGAFLLMDRIGLDTMLRVALEMYRATNDPRLYPPLILFRMVADGKLGAKSGSGFYIWDGKKPTGPADLSAYLMDNAEFNPFATKTEE